MALAICLGASGAMPVWAAGPVASVPRLDISRYAGQWHEIAHLPMAFQKDCASDITARYSLDGPGGLVGVLNACKTLDGATKQAQGVARPVEGHPGRLQVRFAPDWLSWLPWVWADYWVIALDPEYQWAMVGEPDREYLWILSREPTMDRARFEQLKTQAEAMGYDLAPLIIATPLR
ncbi:lipocalin family protein [Pseudoxanthomonas putridarboris]|uniref:Outer membrane lipoprotein Blc n=1 Tax=Pseudoxanthomonas putridarboris TaxID=752605 RepID=A0ABU9J4J3_9GAMM